MAKRERNLCLSAFLQRDVDGCLHGFFRAGSQPSIRVGPCAERELDDSPGGAFNLFNALHTHVRARGQRFFLRVVVPGVVVAGAAVPGRPVVAPALPAVAPGLANGRLSPMPGVRSSGIGAMMRELYSVAW